MLGQTEAIVRLLAAAAAGLGIGLSRRHHPASLRTFALICLGATIFSVIGLRQGWSDDSNARVISQIITGIGFLGLGVIWKQGIVGKPHGLTTAAGIWVVAGLGVLIGLGMWVESLVTLGLSLLILYSKKQYFCLHGVVKSSPPNPKSETPIAWNISGLIPIRKNMTPTITLNISGVTCIS